MILLRRRKVEIRLEPTELINAIAVLSDRDWIPAIYAAYKAFGDFSGITMGRGQAFPLLRSAYPRQNEGYGDVFFKENDIYYVSSQSVPVPKNENATRVFHKVEVVSLEIGLISPNLKDMDKRLLEFSASIQDAVISTLDGRRSRHLKFDWLDIKNESFARVEESVIADDVSEVKTAFEAASLDNGQVLASVTLRRQAIRELMIELSQAGFVREKDLLSRKRNRIDEIKEIISELISCGLVNSECIVECKRTSAPLVRLASGESLRDIAIGGLVCATCGAKFSDENLTEGYTLTQMGRELIKKSHWMTIYVTNCLVELGVPIESIQWNAVDGGEEIDIIAEFSDKRWIFELKDREFGAGDAHPLNYRQVRYKADKAIIITTDKISRDAKRVLDELAREGVRTRQSPFVFIEGLDNLEVMLGKIVSEASLLDAARSLRRVVSAFGLDAGYMLSMKYGK